MMLELRERQIPQKRRKPEEAEEVKEVLQEAEKALREALRIRGLISAINSKLALPEEKKRYQENLFEVEKQIEKTLKRLRDLGRDEEIQSTNA